MKSLNGAGPMNFEDLLNIFRKYTFHKSAVAECLPCSQTYVEPEMWSNFMTAIDNVVCTMYFTLSSTTSGKPFVFVHLLRER